MKLLGLLSVCLIVAAAYAAAHNNKKQSTRRTVGKFVKSVTKFVLGIVKHSTAYCRRKYQHHSSTNGINVVPRAGYRASHVNAPKRISAGIATMAQSKDNSSSNQGFVSKENPVSIKPVHMPCRDTECPSYDLMKEAKGYQLRCYRSAKWVATKQIIEEKNLINKDYPPTQSLFDYIHGSNTERINITLTSPTLTRVQVARKSLYRSLTTFLYVLKVFQDLPPKTDDYTLFITRKKMCVYVRTLKGYVDSYYQYIYHKRIMELDLLKDGLRNDYDDTFFHYASYNHPSMPKQAGRFELWLQKKI